MSARLALIRLELGHLAGPSHPAKLSAPAEAGCGWPGAWPHDVCHRKVLH